MFQYVSIFLVLFVVVLASYNCGDVLIVELHTLNLYSSIPCTENLGGFFFLIFILSLLLFLFNVYDICYATVCIISTFSFSAFNEYHVPVKDSLAGIEIFWTVCEHDHTSLCSLCISHRGSIFSELLSWYRGFHQWNRSKLLWKMPRGWSYHAISINIYKYIYIYIWNKM